jgi:hypothetical protein
MPTEKQFFLKWKRISGRLRYPRYWEGLPWYLGKKPERKDYFPTYRLLAVSVLYYAPYEYVDPITDQPVVNGVVDILERERLATLRYQPRQRLDVRRVVWQQRDSSDRWSPINKYNSLARNGRIIQEYSYDYLEGNREVWLPLWRSFLLANPVLIYGLKAPDLQQLWKLKTLNFLDEDWAQTELNSIAKREEFYAKYSHTTWGRKGLEDLEGRKKWVAQKLAITQNKSENYSYPGLKEGQQPPQTLPIEGQIVTWKLK